MRLPGRAKFLIYGRLGYFHYFRVKTYFPPKSWVFRAACEQGIYEPDVTRLLRGLVKPDSTMFDIGAHIGLSAIPVLDVSKTCRIVSVEVSPTVLRALRKTVGESRYGERWQLKECAVGEVTGETTFAVSRVGEHQFDGIRQTSRVSESSQVRVPVTTVDEIWNELGCPSVSVIKCDVEGGEYSVFAGISECLDSTRPAIVTEWNAENLAAYGTDREKLLSFASEHRYRIFSIPNFVEIMDQQSLQLHMLETENFVLLPREETPNVDRIG
jgi:FkbM family methyltransferase